MRGFLRWLTRRRLSTQVVVMQVAVLALATAVGFAVVQWNLKHELDRQFEQRALAVAQTLASQRSVVNAVLDGQPGGRVQTLATAAAEQTSALFVVITNAKGIRYSHPNPKLIGKPVYDDPEPPSSEPFRTGRPYTGIQTGTLGEVAAGKAPLFDSHGDLVGEVSVGFAVADVSQQLGGAVPLFAAYLIAAFAAGTLAALALARRLKRQTFGLELDQIAALLQQREAMLHGIREAVLGYDKDERVLLANDEARRLLDLSEGFGGRSVRELLPPGRIADVVTGEVTGSDLLVLHSGRVLVANRMPIRQDHRQHLGWVVTFQDRTESESLKRELDEAIGLTETLRAQSHEFANRLHTLVGLVELGYTAEAVQFVTDVSGARGELTDQLIAAIGDPTLAALILGKVSLASEHGVRLRLTQDSHLARPIADVPSVVTVTGNLIDNAIDAVSQEPAPREVDLTLVAAGQDLVIRVRDSGPGVPEELREQIFTDGVTTKSSVTGARRGLGLALVRQIIDAKGGLISVGRDGGAVFTVRIPGCLDAVDLPLMSAPAGAGEAGMHSQPAVEA